MEALQVTHLQKTFDHIQALGDVSLDVAKGQLTAVLGPSGCGKTTLLRCIAGFESPNSGQITIAGQEVCGDHQNMSPEHRRVGYVAQEGALFPHLTVEKNVGFGLTRKQRHSGRVQEMLKLVSMEGLEKRMPHELSGGQQQRVALARALAPSPSILLMDEPFSALDTGLRASLREEVKTAIKETGSTAVMVTHDQEEALSMADQIAVMRDGHIIQTTDPVSLYQSPADLNIASFIGEAIVLQATVYNAYYVDCLLGRVAIDAHSSLEPGRPVSIMIRPEQLVMNKAGEGIHARVVKMTYYGHDALVRLRLSDDLGGAEIHARVSGMESYLPDEHVGLNIRGHVMVYPSEELSHRTL